MPDKNLMFPKKPLFLNIIIWLRILGFVFFITYFPRLLIGFNLSGIYAVVMTVVALIAVFGLLKLKNWGLWLYVALEAIGFIKIIVEALFTSSLSQQFTKIPPELHNFFSIVMVALVIILLLWASVQIIYLIKIRKLFK